VLPPRRLYAAALPALLLGCARGDVAFPPDGAAWPSPATPSWSHQARLAITDDGDDTLAFVSTDPMPALLGFAPVGDDPLRIEAPHHLAASPDGQTLYVNLSNYAPGSAVGPSGAVDLGDMPGVLVKLRASNYEKLAETTLDHDSGDVVLSRDGATAYVSHYDLLKLQDALGRGLPEAQGYSTVAVVDTATMAPPELIPVCATAHGLVLSDDERTLYVACSLADEVAIVDLGSRAVRRVPVGPAAGPLGAPNYFPYAITRSPSDGSVWISCNGGSGGAAWAGVRVYDPKTGAMDDTRALPLNGVAMFGDWLPDGKTLVLPHQGDDVVSIIDTATSMELAAIPTPAQACLRAHMVRVAPGGHSGWLTCEGDHVRTRGTLVTLLLDPPYGVVGYVEVGLYSDGVVLLPPASE
jgi:DNA-binding beta-propeller fold protein YncE